MTVIKTSLPRMRTMFGRSVAVVTVYEDERPVSEVTLVEVLSKCRASAGSLENPQAILEHLVLSLGAGA